MSQSKRNVTAAKRWRSQPPSTLTGRPRTRWNALPKLLVMQEVTVKRHVFSVQPRSVTGWQ
jgi:hypothetical protein